MSNLLTFDNPVFRHFAYYGTLLVGKTVLLAPLTAYFRVKKEVYANPEDLALSKTPGLKTNFNDETVERIRRCHLNDLENILPFAVIGVIFVTCDPHPDIARRLFRVFTIARFIHTIAYLRGVRQPVRAISNGVGVAINLIMVWRIHYVLRFLY